MTIRNLLGKELLYFDGAMGTQLQAAGLQPGENTDLWNLSHPEVVTGVHKAYIAAGANILKTNTFGANALKLAGTGHTVDEVVAAAFANAHRAWDESGAPSDRRFTALDLGPTGKLIEPFGDLPFEKAVDLYAEMVRAGVRAGADLILIETQSDTYEAKAAMVAARENSDLPFFVTFTFDKDGKLLNGADVETAMILADALGAASTAASGPTSFRNWSCAPGRSRICPSSLTRMRGCRKRKTVSRPGASRRTALRPTWPSSAGAAPPSWAAAAARGRTTSAPSWQRRTACLCRLPARTGRL